jgi:hypothetical protein
MRCSRCKHPALHDPPDPLVVPHVGQRVGVDRHQIGCLAGLQCANLFLPSQRARAVPGDINQKLRRVNAGLATAVA